MVTEKCIDLKLSKYKYLCIMNNNVRTWLILGLGKLPMEDDIAIEDLLGQKLDEDISIPCF